MFSLILSSREMAAMIKSMTGFGRGQFSSELFACSAEVKSVNHRYLDIHVRLPQELNNLELKIKRVIQGTLKRGRIDLTLIVEKNEAVSFSFNPALIRAYLQSWHSLRQEFGFEAELDPTQLLRIPGIFNIEPLAADESIRHQVEEGIIQAVSQALSELEQMKIQEGSAIREDLLRRFGKVESDATQIRSLTQGALTAYQERLVNRLNELLGNTTIDSNRLLQEAAFYVERSDITEEVTRLFSHLEQGTTLLNSEGDAGKTLDFLLQEMNREANTILSKSTGMTGNGLEISNHALQIKTEVEKIREQVQNVE
jgi:uncharacterized protein (TIGR00255 family)